MTSAPLTFKEELWSVLLDKTKGEARGKVKSIGNQGDGVEAYRALHVWFTRVTNLGLQERRTKVMMPETAANEGLIVQSVERWERDLRELHEATKEAPLSDAMMRQHSKRL